MSELWADRLVPEMDHPHYIYTASPRRPRIVWPGGARTALLIRVDIDTYDETPAAGPHHRDPRHASVTAPFSPEHRAFGQHEYGPRVGVFRILELLDRHGLRATCPVTAVSAERYPFLMGELTRRGYEIAGHGVRVTRMLSSRMSEAEEAGVFLSPYFNIFVTLLIGGIMVSRYVRALATVERAKDHLAEQLSARERELTESYDKLRAAEQRELLIEERRRVMQDMHDGMGSSLVSALRVVERGELDEAAVIQVLKDCIDDLKLTIDAMEPVEADLMILLATLRFRLQPRLDATGLKLRWRIQDIPPILWLDQHNALHILRILQEAITNVIKHAQASEISMSTEADADIVCITVADNGRGFDPATTPTGGKGLANQMRRATAIGGEVSWTSDACGTRFCLRLPIMKGAGAVRRSAMG